MRFQFERDLMVWRLAVPVLIVQLGFEDGRTLVSMSLVLIDPLKVFCFVLAELSW